MSFTRSNAPLRQSLRHLASIAEGRTAAPNASPLCASPSSVHFAFVRPFSSSPALYKKRKIAVPSDNQKGGAGTPSRAANHDVPSSTTKGSSSSSSSAPPANPEDPLDFSVVTAGYAPIDVHFKAQLAGMSHGGRFNPSNLGSLPISVKDDDGSSNQFPLRELAQVVPRSGRTISLLVHDKSYIKPIMSAVQGSREFNQQPQRSDDNELELLLKVEMERKEEVVRHIKEATQAWRERIRSVRTKHEKTMKDWKKNGTVLPDVFKKAEKELQKLQDKKMKEIDQEETQLIRQLERSSS